MDFFWILLFGTLSVLTDKPLDLMPGDTDISLPTPISAVTHGASLYVDVSAMIPRDEMTFKLSEKWVERNIKPGCVRAILHGGDSKSVSLDFKGGTSFEPGKVHLILANDTGVPVWKEFRGLTLSSCRPLSQVIILWRNYQK